MLNEFVAFPSRWRIALIALGALGLVALGLLMVGAFGPLPSQSARYSSVTFTVIGWVVIAFFGLCGAYAIKMLFETREQLRIGSAGIRWARWSDQTIPWSEISDVTTSSFKGQRSIVLHLRDPARFPGRGIVGFLAGANRMLTHGDIYIGLTGTDRSFDVAMSAIERFRPSEPKSATGVRRG